MKKKVADAEAKNDAAEQNFIEERQRLAEFDFRELQDWTRRVGVAGRNRRQLLETLADKNGVSLEKIDALHEADWQRVQRQAKSRHTQAVRLLKRHHARQRAMLKNVLEHRDRFQYQGGNPIFQTCMWRASNLVSLVQLPFTFNQGTAGLVPPAAQFPVPTVGNNLARFTVRAEANAAGSLQRGLIPVAGLELLSSHVFQTTARADGTLSVTAHYAPLGDVFLGAPGDCLGFGGSAGFMLTLFMEVRIIPPDTLGFDVPRGDVKEIVRESVFAGCDAETRQVLVGPTGGDTYSLTNADIARVDEGDTIRVNARFALRVSAALRGIALADFSGAPSGLNVPLVLAKIET